MKCLKRGKKKEGVEAKKVKVVVDGGIEMTRKAEIYKNISKIKSKKSKRRIIRKTKKKIQQRRNKITFNPNPLTYDINYF